MELFDNFEKNKMNSAPLADRIRPEKLEDFLGQEKIVGPGKPLREAIEKDELQSIILWGPPGSGKTTLARIIAKITKTHFVPFSAAISGVPALRKIIKEAQDRRKYYNQKTILFVDEIHRFNKAQQDAFLPYVEDGTIVLIGATTENPSFEVISPLLSRSTVYILEPLSPEDLKNILEKALPDKEKGLGKYKIKLEPKVLDFIIELAYGDARIALNILEFAVITTKPDTQGVRNISLKIIEEVVQKRCLRYDKTGEEHYNIISALHKSMRDSDPDAAIYWVARMLEAGENPLYVARRLVRFASEDIGNADPQALQVAVSAMQAVHFLGMPEGNLALAQTATYLACAPKSNALYKGYKLTQEDIKRWGPLPVPLVIRNAPTTLMKNLDYGKGYKYAHNFKDGYIIQEHLPKELKGKKYYFPTDRGFEKEIKQRLEKLKDKYKKDSI
ncbi:MAG: replication-associated recombination protein A [Candidatus Caldatribacteriota bacterium]|nr:replication-associated recombination protein A [Candidatus Caldatribacteriota bacterium]